MEENKKKVINKKSLVIIIAVIAVLVIGAVVALLFLNPGAAQKILEPIQKSIYESKTGDLGQPNDDVGVMILSCDSTDELSDARNITVNNRANRYVEGTGAFMNSSFTEIIGQGVFKEMMDISEYKSVHISIYIEDKEKLNDAIWFELTSAVVFDDDEISWLIPISEIENGWNEFYLSIEGAYLTGEPELDALFYFRMFSIGLDYGTTVIYDNIYATNTEGVVYQPDIVMQEVEPDPYKETASSEGLMIVSCNTVNIFESLMDTTVTVEKGEFVEGTGAFKLGVNHSSYGKLATPRNISAYKDGYIHIHLYINDVSHLTKEVNFELSSSGVYDKDEYQWVISTSSLKSGWNELWLPISDGIKLGKPDLSAINFFRIFTMDPTDGYNIILDNVYATNEGARDSYKETAATEGKMITSCNTINTFSKLINAEVTTVKGEFVEGTGALKSTNPTSSLLEANFKKAVDISGYADGYINLSVYINDTSYLGDLLILELTSSGIYDIDEWHFDIPTSSLKNGWNKLSIPMSKSGQIGEPDLSAIDYIRLYTTTDEKKAKRVFIVDNIYVVSADENYVSEETEAIDGKMIASCNTADIFSTLEFAEVTKVSGQYVEGTGALKTTGYSDLLLYGVLATPKDLAAYKDGYVHISFYIDDVTKLTTDVAIELSSSLDPDVDEYQWNVSKDSLKDGWNELWLGYQDTTDLAIIGEPNLSSIKRIRVYTMGQKEGMVTIFDNIYTTDTLYGGSGCSCGNATYIGDILNGDCLCYYQNAFNMKLTNQCVEGDYALQAKKPEAGIYGSFKKAVDISAYKKGYLHISIYIDDVAKLKNNINFELSSSGTYDKNELDWEIKKGNLKNGWNDIWLPMGEAAVTGSVDLSEINYFRLSTPQCDSSLIIRIDDVYASLTK